MPLPLQADIGVVGMRSRVQCHGYFLLRPLAFLAILLVFILYEKPLDITRVVVSRNVANLYTMLSGFIAFVHISFTAAYIRNCFDECDRLFAFTQPILKPANLFLHRFLSLHFQLLTRT